MGLFLALAGGAVAQVPPRTFQPRDGECPWQDRVGQWVIAELPETYAGGPPMPLQSCGARSLVVPEGTKAAVIGVYLKDFENLQASHPHAKDTGERFVIRTPSGKSPLTYMIVILPEPLPKEVFKPGIGSGVVLLKLDPPPETSSSGTPKPPTR